MARYKIKLVPSHSFSGNDFADEDVDICGDDPPMSCYPTLAIEKDAKARNIKCSSSSSSSSDSGSTGGAYLFACAGSCPYIFFLLVFFTYHPSYKIEILSDFFVFMW